MTRAHRFRALPAALLALAVFAPAPGGAAARPADGHAAAAPAVAARAGRMVVALDSGGWGGRAYFDISRAVKAIRLDWHHADDAEVGTAAAAGISVASWLASGRGSIAGIDAQRYAAQVVALFKRYGKGGTFWRGRRDLGGRAVEVLNEPDNPTFWSDAGNARAYVNLLKTVHRALVANFPASIRPRVLASWDGGEGPSSGFGAAVKALGGMHDCQGVTVHAYAGLRGRLGPLGGRYNVEMARAGSRKPVYITEVGWTTALGRPDTGDSQQTTEALQASYVTSFFRWARSTGYVKLAVYFNYVDYGSNDWYGIERRNHSHKPSFAALAQVASEAG